MLSRSALVISAVAVVEIVVFALAATQVDVLLLILVLGALSASGSVFLFRHTAGMIRQSFEDLRAGAPSTGRRLGDRGLKVVGAALLAFPGFVTGVLGGLLLVPPVRAAVRPLIGARLARAVPQRVSMPFDELSRSIRRQQAVDVRSTVKGSDEPQPRPVRPELR